MNLEPPTLGGAHLVRRWSPERSTSTSTCTPARATSFRRTGRRCARYANDRTTVLRRRSAGGSPGLKPGGRQVSESTSPSSSSSPPSGAGVKGALALPPRHALTTCRTHPLPCTQSPPPDTRPSRPAKPARGELPTPPLPPTDPRPASLRARRALLPFVDARPSWPSLARPLASKVAAATARPCAKAHPPIPPEGTGCKPATAR